MRIANREEVATLIFMGVVERVIIGQEENGQWSMYYLRVDGGVQAFIDQAESREDILRQTMHFMDGHGRVLITNLIQSSEMYLGSMHQQPASIKPKYRSTST
jgi:hypothetical protein